MNSVSPASRASLVPPPWLDRTLGPAVVLLVAAFALFELTDLDLWVQDHFYDFGARTWLVEARARMPRFFFYTGAKAVIIALALTLLAFAVGPARWRARLASPAVRRRDLYVVIATLASGPALIALSKATTNVFCPSEVTRYGGETPYVKLCEPYAEGERPRQRGRCFPAGHASGGFALLALAGLVRTRRGRWSGFAIGMAAGWAMGLYQMFKGAHYLSHTVVTMFVVWIIFLLWRRWLRAGGVEAPATDAFPG